MSKRLKANFNKGPSKMTRANSTRISQQNLLNAALATVPDALCLTRSGEYDEATGAAWARNGASLNQHIARNFIRHVERATRLLDAGIAFIQLSPEQIAREAAEQAFALAEETPVQEAA